MGLLYKRWLTSLLAYACPLITISRMLAKGLRLLGLGVMLYQTTSMQQLVDQFSAPVRNGLVEVNRDIFSLLFGSY
ncbi:hypothetical protein F5Y08DRAFT_309407 [Xylaria arbuscula]|nr:hypothetical protein F5Y08DRAFT_309407 [Xylaria arbuscula]